MLYKGLLLLPPCFPETGDTIALKENRMFEILKYYTEKQSCLDYVKCKAQCFWIMLICPERKTDFFREQKLSITSVSCSCTSKSYSVLCFQKTLLTTIYSKHIFVTLIISAKNKKKRIGNKMLEFKAAGFASDHPESLEVLWMKSTAALTSFGWKSVAHLTRPNMWPHQTLVKLYKILQFKVLYCVGCG